MKNILYSLLALFFMSNMATAQLMSDQEHRNMMNAYSVNLNGILAPIAAQQGLTLDQLKKSIINGQFSLGFTQDEIIAAAAPLKDYGAQFALANGLSTPDDNYEYFYAAFTPSTIIKNGKLAFSGAPVTQMWTCALDSFNANNCGSFLVASDKNNLNNIATTGITQLTRNSSWGNSVLLMINKFSDCIYKQLGHKLLNPYATANMQQAFANITNINTPERMSTSIRDSIQITNFSINTSHLYVKIEPKDELEESLLLNDTLQEFHDAPLDFVFPEETEEEVSVVDENGISTYWATVPLGYVFPAGIATTVLDELYIPEEDPYFEQYLKTEAEQYNPVNLENMNDFFNTLLLEAFTLTGNEAEWDWQIIPETNKSAKSSNRVNWRLSAHKWVPTGNVTLYDNTINPNLKRDGIVDLGGKVSMEGVKVYVQHWFRTKTGITNENGNFQTKRMRGVCKHSIRWNRYDFEIRKGVVGGEARTKITKLRNQPYDVFLTDEHDRYYATLFQAAHDYYYKEIEGLNRPPKNAWYKIKLRVRALEQNGSSFTLPLNILPKCYVQKFGSTSEAMYGTTIHELTHAAHMSNSVSNYHSLVWKAYEDPGGWFSSVNDMTQKRIHARRLMESWPVAVEIKLTKLRYNRLRGDTLYVYNKLHTVNNFQEVPFNATDDVKMFYTPVFYDLIDGYNQKVKLSSIPNLPQDRVSGFTIKQVQDIIMQCESWGEMQDKFRAISPTIQENGSTIILTDELFNNWQ